MQSMPQSMAQSTPQTNGGRSGLTRLLEAELSRFPARAGLYVKHLRSGEEAGVRADEPFNSASVIKLPVMVIAYQMADRKELNLDERVEIRKSDYRGGTGIFKYHDLGQMPTLRDVITEMIITSDNTATDMMIARVGGVERVNQWLGDNGYKGLRLNSTADELFRKRYELLDPKYRNLTPEDVFALGGGSPAFTDSRRKLIDEVAEASKSHNVTAEFFKRMEADHSFWLGDTSPRDTVRLLETIETGTAASKQACAEMAQILRRQQSGARRLPHFLNVPVGHKTGDYPPAVANDVGIIYARSGPIVVAVFTRNNIGPYAETEDRIGIVARMIVDYFDGPSEPIK
jgi:beta-lactamase class A